MTMTNVEANNYINHMLRAQAYTPPATNYVAFFLDTPDVSGAGTEVSDVNYARQAITLAAPSPDRITHNTNTITLPAPAVDQGLVVAVAIYDVVSAGNMRLFGAIAPFTLLAGTQIEFSPGQLVISGV